MAERARMSANGIGALERGARRTPQRETLTLLAKALSLDRGTAPRVRNRCGTTGDAAAKGVRHRRPVARDCVARDIGLADQFHRSTD